MKALFKYILYSTFFAMSLPLVTACDDDEATDPYDINYVYIYKPSETNATLEYKGDGTFLKEIATEHILSPVRCTKPAPQDLTIQLAIDRSLVDAYNSEYGTSYVALQNAELENATLYIKQGEYISADTLKVHYTNMEEFKNGSENYILPIAITSINGTGVSASESNSKIFLTFESTYKPNHVTLTSSKEYLLEYQYSQGFTNLSSEWKLDGILKSAWATDGDTKVTLAINPALVGTYNALHGTDYSLLTSASLKQSTIMIKQGKTTPEESVALSFSDDMASVQLGTNYVIPVTITNVDGVGADIGENKVIYIVYKTALVGFLSCVDKPVGSVINDHSGWSFTLNGQSSDLYDYVPDGSILEIDLGKQENIKTIALHFYEWFYSSESASIAISNDGEKYEDLGVASGFANKTSYILLLVAKQAQYIRVTFHGALYYSPYINTVGIYTETE